MRVRLVLFFIGLVLVWPALPGGPHHLQAQAPIGADDIVARVQQAFYFPGRDLKAPMACSRRRPPGPTTSSLGSSRRSTLQAGT